jgi:hypothetical protein
LLVSHWRVSHRFDARALPLADRHYNRQKVGSPQFVPPGRCLVLLTADADALWVTSWPFADFTKHAWAGAWVNSCFRNESPTLSSDLIREAVAHTRGKYPEAPALGMVTFIDPSEVPGDFERTPDGTVLDWGYCYVKAGFHRVGWTKGGLRVLQLLPTDMPGAIAPTQRDLFATEAA